MKQISAASADAAPSTMPQALLQDPQVTLLQQQVTALTAMVASSFQHTALSSVAAAANMSGYGTPARSTPPVFQPHDMLQLGLLQIDILAQYATHCGTFTCKCLSGTYPHLGTPSSRSVAKPTSLTEQEMQAAAVAAAEQGYHDREYYVDDGNEAYYYDYDGEDSACVGPEGQCQPITILTTS